MCDYVVNILCYLLLLYCCIPERLMNDVVENIFDCLDYQSLKNSETVSAEWYNSILYGRIWKRLWEKNVNYGSDIF